MNDIILVEDFINSRTQEHCYRILKENGTDETITCKEFEYGEANNELNVIAVNLNRDTIDKVHNSMINCDAKFSQMKPRMAIKFRTIDDFETYIKKLRMLGKEIDKVFSHIFEIVDENTITLISDVKIVIIDGIELFAKTAFSSIDLTNIDMSLCKETSSMFHSCHAESINMTGVNMNAVIGMNAMFKFSEAKNIYLDNVLAKSIKSTYAMFYYCQQIKKIDISSLCMDDVITAEDMFRGCENLQEINLGDNNLNYIPYKSGMFAFCNANKINKSKERNLGLDIKFAKKKINKFNDDAKSKLNI